MTHKSKNLPELLSKVKVDTFCRQGGGVPRVRAHRLVGRRSEFAMLKWIGNHCDLVRIYADPFFQLHM